MQNGHYHHDRLAPDLLRTAPCRTGAPGPPCGCLVVPLSWSPRTGSPRHILLWWKAWPGRPGRSSTGQDTFIHSPARKWKPEASPAHTQGCLASWRLRLPQRVWQTPWLFSLHRNRHNRGSTQPRSGQEVVALPAAGSAELEADRGIAQTPSLSQAARRLPGPQGCNCVLNVGLRARARSHQPASSSTRHTGTQGYHSGSRTFPSET